MRPDVILAGYMTVMLLALVVLWISNSMRRRRFLSGPAEDRVFRCLKCGGVYTDDPDVDLSRCPQCGKMNESFDFRA
ncbi:MAG: hypothetical protein IT581_10940 [Verrucomicrobiales bacterium]|nr:hypothetical protein [Verrucomicrobiales bacterium]